MQDIIAKYRKILEKPVPAPFDGYLRELVEALEGKPKIPRAPSTPKFPKELSPENGFDKGGLHNGEPRDRFGEPIRAR
jgi:hypothetical protein